MQRTITIATLGEQYDITVDIGSDTVLALKTNASSIIRRPIEELVTDSGVILSPPSALLKTFQLEQGAMINASLTSLEFATEDPQIEVLLESKYDPTAKLFKSYLAPCTWKDEHGRQGPGPGDCRWKYSTKSTLNTKLVLDALRDQPVKKAVMQELFAAEGQAIMCNTLSVAWQGWEGVPGSAGSVTLVEGKFQGYVILMYLRGDKASSNPPDTALSENREDLFGTFERAFDLVDRVYQNFLGGPSWNSNRAPC